MKETWAKAAANAANRTPDAFIDAIRKDGPVMTKMARGFTIGWLCFPIREWSNWKWGRECPDQMFAIGPMRVDFCIKYILR